MSTPQVPTYTQLLEENLRLKAKIKELEVKLNATTSTGSVNVGPAHATSNERSAEEKLPNSGTASQRLSNEQIFRYSRQLLLPEIAVAGQRNLLKTLVLVVGAGGLGAPVCLYLAAAGVGHIGIVDADSVELNNLHRQVIHSEASLGVPKAVSAAEACRRLNSSIHCEPVVARFDESNAMELVKQHDIIVDASDNVATRYLINDAVILCKKVLVSGSALRMEGQVTVYGYKGGPCYRCLYPQPPPAETVTNCNDGGVLGAITGIIGCIQALEVIKIAAGQAADGDVLSQRLLLFDGSSCQFRNVKLRPRLATCAVCGDHPTVTKLVNYVQFCAGAFHDKPLLGSGSELKDTSKRTAKEYAQKAAAGERHVLLDVREKVQFDIAALPGALNIPLRQLQGRLSEVHAAVASARDKSGTPAAETMSVYVLCRRGVDSVTATKLLLSHLDSQYAASVASGATPGPNAGNASANPGGSAAVPSGPVPAWLPRNIQGGLLAYSRDVDPSFPVY